MSPIDVRREFDPDAIGGGDETLRGLVKAGDEAALAMARALGEESRPEVRLSRTGRADHQGPGEGKDAPANHGTEARYPGPQHLAVPLHRSAISDKRFGTWVDDHATPRDRKRVRAVGMVGAAHLHGPEDPSSTASSPGIPVGMRLPEGRFLGRGKRSRNLIVVRC